MGDTMTAFAKIPRPANTQVKESLASVYPPYAAKIRLMCELADSDPEAAAVAFAEATVIARAFWSGVDFACGSD